MQPVESVGSSNWSARNIAFHSCCFFFRLSDPHQIFPAQFQSILIKHQRNRITLLEDYKIWIVELDRQWFGEGWREFYRNNILRQSDNFLLRHSESLVFDVIHFSEDHQQARMPWTDPLPSILHLQPSFDLEMNRKRRIVRQQVLSSMKPDFAHSLAEGTCFYQIITRRNQHNFKVPRFSTHWLHGDKTPYVTLRTGNKMLTLTMHGRQFMDNWDVFAAEHHLKLDEVLVFLPESASTYNVLLFDKYGVKSSSHGIIIFMCTPS